MKRICPYRGYSAAILVAVTCFLLFISCKTEDIIIEKPRPEISYSDLLFERDFGTENYRIYQLLNVKAGNYFEALEVGICWSTQNTIPTVTDSRLFFTPEVPAAYRNSSTNYELKNLKRDLPYYFRQYIITSTDTIYHTVEKTLIPGFYCDNLPSILPTEEQNLAPPPPAFFSSSSYKLTTASGLTFINIFGNILNYDVAANKWELNKNASFTFSENELQPNSITQLTPFIQQDSIRAFDFMSKRLIYTSINAPKWQAKPLNNVPDNRTLDVWFKTDSNVVFVAKPENPINNEYYGEKEIWCYDYASNDFELITKLTFNNVGINFLTSVQSDSKVYVLLNEYLKPTPEVWEFEPMKNAYRKVIDFQNSSENSTIYQFRNSTNLFYDNGKVTVLQTAFPISCTQDIARIVKVPILKITVDISSSTLEQSFLKNNASDYSLLFPFWQDNIYQLDASTSNFKQLIIK